MNVHAPPHELRDWITRHLDPLDESDPVTGQPRTYDHDLIPGWSQPDQPLTPASVLVGLVERPQGLTVILTRRADTLRRHTGQIALPGGRATVDYT